MFHSSTFYCDESPQFMTVYLELLPSCLIGDEL